MDLPVPVDQILDGSLPEAATKDLMASLGFADSQSAALRLQHIAGRDSAARQFMSKLLPHLLSALAGCANPDQALINLERFIDGMHEIEPLGQLTENPSALAILITIFSGSQFLAEILVRDPRHLDVLIHRERLARRKKAEDFEQEAMQA